MQNSIQEAFLTIERQKEGIPLEAIRFLYNHPQSRVIRKKIIYALKHAYDDTYYDVENDHYFLTPLWYAIVAENHLSKKIVNPVIKLFTATNDDWDFLDEQGLYLIGKLAEKYPDFVMKKVMRAIDKMLTKNLKLPYLYLFDAFFYVDAKKYKRWFLKTLQKENLYWKGVFVNHISDLQIKEAIPILKKMLEDEYYDTFEKGDIEESIEELEEDKKLFPDIFQPYCKTRGKWEEHYANWEQNFYDAREEDNDNDNDNEFFNQPPIRIKKIRRNEPCPCGSGKKYKKCCIDKGLEYINEEEDLTYFCPDCGNPTEEIEIIPRCPECGSKIEKEEKKGGDKNLT